VLFAPLTYRLNRRLSLFAITMETRTFPNLKFQGQLRPSQPDVAEIARQKLQAGQRRLHIIVAPPGSRKTGLSLNLWAEHVRTSALVFSPNSAIQAQWAARTSLLLPRTSNLPGVVD